jgi:solute:Na+ symporter, SSS family
LALVLQNALQLFEVILMFGAGTGLIFILRWFWWRINAWSEIAAMFSSGIISIIINFTSVGVLLFADETGVFPAWSKFPIIVLVTTVIWVLVTYLTQPESNAVLRDFYQKIQPGGPGWSKVIQDAKSENIDIVNDKEGWSVPSGIIAMLLGCVLIYSSLFATGYWIYGETTLAISITITAIVSGFLLKRVWSKIRTKIL